jgi:hypothetical protein
MQTNIAAVLIVALVTTVAAQQGKPDVREQKTIQPDSILGTWKLNVSQSKFSPREMTPRQHTESYRLLGGNRIELVLTRTANDGSADNFKGTWPLTGGVIEEADDVSGLLIVEGLIAPGEWFVTQTQKGKQFATIHKTVSKDGRTMRQVVRGVDEKGNRVDHLQVFDRQN